MRVRDNGAGIQVDDLALALSRHATSKIADLADLESVATLGFRGEALPSIASVSRLEPDLARRGRGCGPGAFAATAAIGPHEPAAGVPSVGTTVEVRDLFYNTPARRKFLRTEKTEFSHLEQVVERIALAQPDVRFRLSHNGAWSVRPAAARRRRAAVRNGASRDLLGAGFLEHALPATRRRSVCACAAGWRAGVLAQSGRPAVSSM